MRIHAAALAIIAAKCMAYGSTTLTDVDLASVNFSDCEVSELVNNDFSVKDLMLHKFSSTGSAHFMALSSCDPKSIAIGVDGKTYKLKAGGTAELTKGATFYSADGQISATVKYRGKILGDEDDTGGEQCINDYDKYSVHVDFKGKVADVVATKDNQACDLGYGTRNGVDEIIEGELSKIRASSEKRENLPSIVKIGVAVPLFGDDSVFGKEFANGAQLAVDELNQGGAVVGGRKVTIQLVKVDDAENPMSAAKRLVENRVGAVIGHLTYRAAESAGEVYKEINLPLISPSSFHLFSGVDYKYGFSIITAPDALTSAEVKYVLSHEITSSGGFVYKIKERINSAGIHEPPVRALEQKEAYAFNKILKNGTEAAWRVDLPRIAPSGVLVLNVRPAAISYFVKYLAGDEGLKKIYIIPMDGVCPSSIDDGPTNVSIVCMAEASAETLNPNGMRVFTQRYHQAYGETVTPFGPYGYDAVQIVFSAMQKAASVNPEDYLLFLMNRTEYHGLTGEIRFKRGLQTLDRPIHFLELYEYMHGKRQSATAVSVES